MISTASASTPGAWTTACSTGTAICSAIPRAYRCAVDEDFEETWKIVDFPTLFARTGIANQNFNTVYQLYRRKREGDVALENAQTMLLLPDLLGYFLTGEKKSEYTEVTTTMLYNPTTKDWDWETIRELGLPEHIFTEIDRAGTLRGHLRLELAKELGINEASFAAVGTHDTASAVAYPRHRQLRVLLLRYLVALRRGDGQADPPRRCTQRQLLQ